MYVEHRGREDELRARYTGIVRRAIFCVLRSCQELSPPVVDYVFYGAPHVHPGHLAIWFAFADAAALQEARARGLCEAMRRTLLVVLRSWGYPVEVLPRIEIGFVCREEPGEHWTCFG